MAKEPTQTAAEEDDPQKPSQLEPYPTGNPPDPMEEYYKAHPERKPPATAAAPEPEPEPEAEDEDEDEDEQPYQVSARNTKNKKGK